MTSLAPVVSDVLWTPPPLYATPMPESFPTFGFEVCDWIERHCVFPADAWLGQPFRLLPWQRNWINELYAVDEDETTGEFALRFRWALLGVPKKNGKTALDAALALYHVFGDPEELDPFAVCAAASDEQADLVFGAASRMVEYSPTLSKVASVGRKTITAKRGPGTLMRLASSKGKNDGKNISFAILDELHEWEEENFTIVTNGTVGRRRAQIILTTTAGFDLDTVCGAEYIKGVAIAEGRIANRTYSMRWYGAPQGASHRDPEVWRNANPSYGLVIGEAALRDKMENGKEGKFRRYFLNQWTGSEDLWLEEGVWDNCYVPGVSMVKGKPTWIGWDASTKRDSTAVVTVQWDGDFDELLDAIAKAREEYEDDAEIDTANTDAERERVFISLLVAALSQRLNVEARIWDRPLDEMTGKPVEDWMVPVGEVEAYVRWCGENFDVREVAYDPMFISWSAIGFEAQGMPLVEFPQTDQRMVPATMATYELLRLGKLAHAGAEDFTTHIGNTAVVTVRNGGERLAKGKAKRPMDASVGTVMAVYRAVKALLGSSAQTPHLWIPGED